MATNLTALLDDLEHPPPGVDLNASLQANLLGGLVSTYALALVAVVLRVISRRLMARVGLWYDDWAVIVSLLFATGNFITMVIWVAQGTGKHVYLYGLEGFENFFKNLFAIEIWYFLSICFTKYSVLLFYWRIFGKHNVRIPVYILGTLSTLWGIGHFVTILLQCQPTSGFWDKTIPSQCNVSVADFFIGTAVPNILTDWAILMVPVPFIWRLQRSGGQKIALMGVFLLGGFVSIMSAIRLAILIVVYTPTVDQTWIYVGPGTWTAIEINVGIVSACLPSLRPILSWGKKHIQSNSGPTTPAQRRISTRLPMPSLSKSRRSRYKSTVHGLDNPLASDVDLTGINVTTRIDIDEESTVPESQGSVGTEQALWETHRTGEKDSK